MPLSNEEHDSQIKMILKLIFIPKVLHLFKDLISANLSSTISWGVA